MRLQVQSYNENKHIHTCRYLHATASTHAAKVISYKNVSKKSRQEEDVGQQ